MCANLQQCRGLQLRCPVAWARHSSLSAPSRKQQQRRQIADRAPQEREPPSLRRRPSPPRTPGLRRAAVPCHAAWHRLGRRFPVARASNHAWSAQHAPPRSLLSRHRPASEGCVGRPPCAVSLPGRRVAPLVKGWQGARPPHGGAGGGRQRPAAAPGLCGADGRRHLSGRGGGVAGGAVYRLYPCGRCRQQSGKRRDSCCHGGRGGARGGLLWWLSRLRGPSPTR
mmetsp:Transcript_38203/g.107957  ORF Transcript_38203/g.107957 Transcript_38203/m.107957 type:complete len:225 (-) Transcript_38203:1941-2615(-)